MTRPTFASLATLAGGWLFASRHNVTGSLRAARDAGGRGGKPKHFSAYHRVFSAARWSCDAVGLAMLDLALTLALAAGAAVFLVIDDTLCPKRGRKMFGVDSHYDAANTGRKRSNSNQSLKRRGHCWVVLGIVIFLPCCMDRPCCLPLLFRLYMNRKGARRDGVPYRSKPQLARDLLALACARHAGRRFHALADTAYAGQQTVRGLPSNCDLTARWQTNVRLCEPAPASRKPGQKGPLPARGAPLPSPREMLDGRCEHLEVELYGKRRTLRVASRVACLHTVPDRTLRLVATEPLTASGHPRPRLRAFYFSTAADAGAAQVLQWYALRWTVEVAFHDARQQAGFGQPQGWTQQAAQRTAPTLMLLHDAVVLWFLKEGHRSYRKPLWPWYRNKTAIGFADMLATLRTCTLRQHLKRQLANPLQHPGCREPLRLLLRFAKLAA